MFILRFLLRIIAFPIYFILCVVSVFASIIVNFASFGIGLFLLLIVIGGVFSAIMNDFSAVQSAFILLGITSVGITIIGFAQGFLEMIRDSVGELVFG